MDWVADSVRKTGLLRERVRVQLCVILFLSHSRNLNVCLKMLCRLFSTKVFSAFAGFVPWSNGCWGVANTSQRDHCFYCLTCRAWLAWINPDRPPQGNDMGSTRLCSVRFLAVLTHPHTKWPKSVCCAPPPCTRTMFEPCCVVGKHGARAAAGRPARTEAAPLLLAHPHRGVPSWTHSAATALPAYRELLKLQAAGLTYTPAFWFSETAR